MGGAVLTSLVQLPDPYVARVQLYKPPFIMDGGNGTRLLQGGTSGGAQVGAARVEHHLAPSGAAPRFGLFQRQEESASWKGIGPPEIAVRLQWGKQGIGWDYLSLIALEASQVVLY